MIIFLEEESDEDANREKQKPAKKKKEKRKKKSDEKRSVTKGRMKYLLIPPRSQSHWVMCCVCVVEYLHAMNSVL